MKRSLHSFMFAAAWFVFAQCNPSVFADAAQSESVAQLRTAIESRYSYREVRVVDWAAAWKRFEPRLAAAKSAREFAVAAGEMLAATEDPHIWLTVGSEMVPAFRRDIRNELNADLKLLARVIQDWKQPHSVIATGRAAPGIGYLAIHSWERKHAPQALAAALVALGELGSQPALIVDVRFNSGGDERLAREFAGCFVRERAMYARHVTVDPASGGFSAPVERWIEPTPGRPTYSGRVVVLMGRANMSSAEAFLLMMKQAPNVTLIGDRSYGASGNPQPHALANGVTVYLPSWKAMLPDGTPLETKGIAPTIEVRTTPSDFTSRDPVLEKAIAFLQQ